MTAAETRALLSALSGQRRHVLQILDGLSDVDLRRPVLPSDWSCLGLVQHLALDVERFWFRAVVAGEAVELNSGDGAWQVAQDVPPDEVFALYRSEIELADAIISTTALESAPAWWSSELFPGLPERDLHEIVLSVITETACHAGHLDVVRELIDGRTWLVLT